MRLIGLAVILAFSVNLAPLAAETQQAATVRRIGYLGDTPARVPQIRAAFLQGLSEFGYIEGRNLVIEYRFAEGARRLLPLSCGRTRCPQR